MLILYGYKLSPVELMDIEDHLIWDNSVPFDNNESDNEDDNQRFTMAETEVYEQSLTELPIDLYVKGKNSGYIFGFVIAVIKTSIRTKNIKSLQLEKECESLMNIESLVKEWKEENRFIINKINQVVPIKRRGEFFLSRENRIYN